ncbi:hypothetical protein VULLAG_LOCUS18152 [Vulpes lagopus]
MESTWVEQTAVGIEIPSESRTGGQLMTSPRVTEKIQEDGTPKFVDGKKNGTNCKYLRITNSQELEIFTYT